MGELMLASAAVKEVLSLIVSRGRQEIGLLWNCKKDLEDMEETLEILEAVLDDAEKRCVNDKAYNLWLSKLKDACYDIEDMMDDFMLEHTNKLNPQVQHGILVKVRKVFHFPNLFKARGNLAHSMKNMRKRLSMIADLKNNFQIREGTGLDLQAVIRNRETFSVYGSQSEFEFVGREKETKMIVNLILENKNNHTVPFIVHIVGFGGLGKTTLATLVFNDKRMKDEDRFQIRLWIYVSIEFNLLKVATTIANSSTSENVSYTSLETVSTKLKDLVAEKRYLIVLDDVWSQTAGVLPNLFRMLSGGLRGSTVVLTSRNRISDIVPLSYHCELEPLSEEACWQLFQQRAFESPDEVNIFPGLVEIGMRIVSKCKGVALSVISFASVLRSNRDENFWLYIETDEAWDLNGNTIAESSLINEHGSKPESKILSSLWLSYYFLPLSLKSCFNYCSIFKKGDVIKKIDLIEQWISVGFIQSSTNQALYAIAQQYFKKFLSMSFFLSIEANHFSEDEGEYLTMHDLVHDLARLTAMSDNVAHRYISRCGQQWTPKTKKHSILTKKPRALHLYSSDTRKLCTKKSFPQLRCLRVLQLKDCDSIGLLGSVDKLKKMRYLSFQKHSVFPNITGLPYVRYLDLSYSTLDKIPHAISKLQTLCYLNISSSPLATLPESICNLCNLQYLYVSSTLLTTLPESIGQLRNLCHLSVSDKLTDIPESTSNLENLQKLNLSHCDGLVTLSESIGKLKGLIHLNLSYCSSIEKLPENLGNLENLQTLDLSHCDAVVTLPESFDAIGALVHLDLSYCSKLERLPEYSSNLQMLQILDISHCNGLLTLPQSIDKLQFLRRLSFSNCDHLLILPESIVCLGKLVHLNLSDCSNLQGLPEKFGELSNLQYLNMANCSNLMFLPKSFKKLVILEELILTGCSGIPTLPLSWQDMNSLRYLFLDGCNFKPFLPIVTGITKLTNLETLTLQDFRVGEYNLEGKKKKLDTAEVGSGQYCSPALLRDMDMLTGTLRITGLEKLSHWRELAEAKLEKKKKLDTLELVWYSDDTDTNYTWYDLDVVRLPSSLRYLEIWGFAGRKLPTFRLSEDHCLTTIKLCNIRRCRELPNSLLYLGRVEHLHLEIGRPMNQRINEEAFSSLKTLVLVDEAAYLILNGVEIGKQHFPCLASLDISSCSFISQLPEWLGEVSTLKYIRINDCKNIIYLPDSLTRLPQLVTLYIGTCHRIFLEHYEEGWERRKIAHIPHLRITADSIPREEFLATQRPMQN